MLADACRSAGQAYFIIALEDHADPERLGSHPHGWVRLGAGGRMVELARRERVTRIVFAGHVARPSLRALRPDLYTARILARIGLKALGDDRLMRHVVGAAEAEGFEVVGVDAILGEALAPTGTVTRLAPDETARADIGRGIEVARALGRADCGQSVVVQQGIVLALEAVEGTDAAMTRAGTLSRKGPGGVLVKVSKPGQDRRMDLPCRRSPDGGRRRCRRVARHCRRGGCDDTARPRRTGAACGRCGTVRDRRARKRAGLMCRLRPSRRRVASGQRRVRPSAPSLPPGARVWWLGGIGRDFSDFRVQVVDVRSEM